jgi:3-hydroxyacyl-[acyl-carrier-protein] dehydratase
MLFSKEDVLKYLPQKPPFLFVDAIESIYLPNSTTDKIVSSPKELVGGKVVGRYCMQEENIILQGHFPNNPIVPGVIQVEMMAQSSSFVLLKLFEYPFSNKMEVALLSIQHTKFRKPVAPEMDLRLTSICRKVRGDLITQDCQIHHNDDLMSEATIMAMVKFY